MRVEPTRYDEAHEEGFVASFIVSLTKSELEVTKWLRRDPKRARELAKDLLEGLALAVRNVTLASPPSMEAARASPRKQLQ